MYVYAIYCAFVRSWWMVHITLYWRSIKFISLLREYEANAIKINVMCCNSRSDLHNVSFILKIPIFSELYLRSRIYMVHCFFSKNILILGVIQENNLGVGRSESSKPSQCKVSYVQLGGLASAVSCPSQGSFGAEPPYKNCLAF